MGAQGCRKGIAVRGGVRRRCVPIGIALVAALILAPLSPARAGDGEQYIEAYNVLIRMLVSRCQAAESRLTCLWISATIPSGIRGMPVG